MATRDIVHMNISVDGSIYCRQRNSILKHPPCEECDMAYGSAQGAGMECIWEDYFVEGLTVEPVNFEPIKERLRVAKLIDAKVITERPKLNGKEVPNVS